MIKVFDNIINDFEQLIIKKHLYEACKWSFIEDVSLENNLHQRRPGFKIIFENNHSLSSYFETIINNTAKKIKLKNPELLEARSFLQLPLNKKYVGEGVDTPHLDRTEPHLVFLLHLVWFSFDPNNMNNHNPLNVKEHPFQTDVHFYIQSLFFVYY